MSDYLYVRIVMVSMLLVVGSMATILIYKITSDFIDHKRQTEDRTFIKTCLAHDDLWYYNSERRPYCVYHHE